MTMSAGAGVPGRDGMVVDPMTEGASDSHRSAGRLPPARAWSTTDEGGGARMMREHVPDLACPYCGGTGTVPVMSGGWHQTLADCCCGGEGEAQAVLLRHKLSYPPGKDAERWRFVSDGHVVEGSA